MAITSRIVRNAMQNKPGAVNALVEHCYYDALYFATSRIGPQEAEEIAQQTMLRIVQNIKTLKDPSSFKAWMFRIVKNEINMHLRKTKHFSMGELDEEIIKALPDEDQEFLPEEYVLEEEKRKLVVDTMHDLPENYSDCIFLYYYEDMSYAEIAATLEVNEDKVKNNLYRGKTLLKKLLQEKTDTNFAFAPALLPASALSQIFTQDASSEATVEGTARCLEYIQTQVLVEGVGQAAAQAGMSGGMKVAVGIVTALAGVGIAAGAGLALLDQPQKELAESVPVAIAPTPQEEAQPAEAPILTIADMIGDEKAMALEGFEAQGISASEYQAFLEAIEAQPADVADEGGVVYQLYTLTKQDKQLLLIHKSTPGSEQLDVRYRFGTIKEIPLMVSLIIEFYG